MSLWGDLLIITALDRLERKQENIIILIDHTLLGYHKSVLIKSVF